MTSDVLEYHVLVDTDAFVGKFYPRDAHHARCKAMFAELRAERKRLVTTSLVVLETATVLSNRTGQEAACRFLEGFIKAGKIDVVHISQELQNEAVDLFLEQTKKGTSVVDCSNVVVMHRYHIPTIFSFDRFYKAFVPVR
jgi:predicted nucleic acid-binding protein